MRILVVGAGAVGGWFGGMVLKGGGDVTFLVRERREQQLRTDGLVLQTPDGETRLPAPPTVRADALHDPYDLILLSCKGFDLDDAIASFAPAVGPQTAILPLLNGMRHLAVLDARFGAHAVLGGFCAIASTMLSDGTIVQQPGINPDLAFGERDGAMSARVTEIAAELGRGCAARASDRILAEMWEKWLLIATLGGMTTLMRAPVGDIVAGGGAPIALALIAEIAAIADAQGFPIRPEMLERVRSVATAAGSPLTASMFRDMQRNLRIEGDHVFADLLARASSQAAAPVLSIVVAGVLTYEARRAREAASGAP